ncbi:hypothetical protein K435DRAFT_789584 [Dendrothele bispora CBS 962.96]|uniref:Uncharacterized protein n=1 Tax=Dendrothele bispora (strain CBS 962.96) TaxID=1314807 RepID=A0A4S8MSN3_DENBC|nr:hypothetical protein K435DRAFT_789584 [Dendrothele bispora CBS 962.96]
MSEINFIGRTLDILDITQNITAILTGFLILQTYNYFQNATAAYQENMATVTPILGSSKIVEFFAVVLICITSVAISKWLERSFTLFVSTNYYKGDRGSPYFLFYVVQQSGYAVQVLQKSLAGIPNSSNFQAANIAGLLMETFFAIAAICLMRIKLKTVDGPLKLVVLITRWITYTGALAVIVSLLLIVMIPFVLGWCLFFLKNVQVIFVTLINDDDSLNGRNNIQGVTGMSIDNASRSHGSWDFGRSVRNLLGDFFDYLAKKVRGTIQYRQQGTPSDNPVSQSDGHRHPTENNAIQPSSLVTTIIPAPVSVQSSQPLPLPPALPQPSSVPNTFFELPITQILVSHPTTRLSLLQILSPLQQDMRVI